MELRILSVEQFDKAVMKSVKPLEAAINELGEDGDEIILMIVTAFAANLRRHIFHEEEKSEGTEETPASTGADEDVQI